MVRAALASKRRIGQGPKPVAGIVPAGTVVLASLLAVLPIVASRGWYPDFGYLVFLAWRLLRADPWPAWWALPLGLINDLFTGAPIGFSIALWSATMLALELIDRRTMWRDYWIEWMLAALFLLADEWLQLRIGGLWRIGGTSAAEAPFASILPPLLISICVFPMAAWIVSRIDRWRLGR